MDTKFLNEEKNLEGMCDFIKSKGQKHCRNGWSYITNEVVFAWAVMYFALPNSILKIKNRTVPKTKVEKDNNTSHTPNNVISLEKAKEKKNTQLSLFGGDNNE